MNGFILKGERGLYTVIDGKYFFPDKFNFKDAREGFCKNIQVTRCAEKYSFFTATMVEPCKTDFLKVKEISDTVMGSKDVGNYFIGEFNGVEFLLVNNFFLYIGNEPFMQKWGCDSALPYVVIEELIKHARLIPDFKSDYILNSWLNDSNMRKWNNEEEILMHVYTNETISASVVYYKGIECAVLNDTVLVIIGENTASIINPSWSSGEIVSKAWARNVISNAEKEVGYKITYKASKDEIRQYFGKLPFCLSSYTLLGKTYLDFETGVCTATYTLFGNEISFKSISISEQGIRSAKDSKLVEDVIRSRKEFKNSLKTYAKYLSAKSGLDSYRKVVEDASKFTGCNILKEW